MAKTAIISGAHPAPPRGDDPPYPPMSADKDCVVMTRTLGCHGRSPDRKAAVVSGAHPAPLRGDDLRTSDVRRAVPVRGGAVRLTGVGAMSPGGDPSHGARA
jgi:hypothetical protein